MLV
ncbi:hypothetical protein ECEC4422_1453, partial [Escherichia coli EC4422]|jgi:hypothetical protein